MPKTRRRNKVREQFWRDTIAAWQESGQSVRAFCAARSVSEATFFARRRELTDRQAPNVPLTGRRLPSSSRSRSFPTRRPGAALTELLPDAWTSAQVGVVMGAG